MHDFIDEKEPRLAAIDDLQGCLLAGPGSDVPVAPFHRIAIVAAHGADGSAINEQIHSGHTRLLSAGGEIVGLVAPADEKPNRWFLDNKLRDLQQTGGTRFVRGRIGFAFN